MCVCISIYVYVYTYIHIHVYIYTLTHVYICIHIYMHTCCKLPVAHSRAMVRAMVCMYVCIHMHTHIWYVCMCVCNAYTHMVCMYVCMQCIHTYEPVVSCQWRTRGQWCLEIVQRFCWQKFSKVKIQDRCK